MSLILPTQTAASVATPAAGYVHQFIDSADGVEKTKNSAGVVTGSPFLATTVANRAARLALTTQQIGQIVNQTAPVATYMYLGGGESTPANWKLIGSQVSAISADVTRTSTTTLTDAGFLLDLEVGTYTFEAMLMSTIVASSNLQAKLQFVLGATLTAANLTSDGAYAASVNAALTPTGASVNGGTINSAANFTAVFFSAGGATSAISYVRLRGGLVVSVAGNLTLSFAQSSAVSNVITLLAGSFLEARKA